MWNSKIKINLLKTKQGKHQNKDKTKFTIYWHTKLQNRFLFTSEVSVESVICIYRCLYVEERAARSFIIPPHQQKPVAMSWAFDQDVSWTLPRWHFLGISKWEENKGCTQDMLERLCLLAGLRMAQCCPRGSGGGGQRYSDGWFNRPGPEWVFGWVVG